MCNLKKFLIYLLTLCMFALVGCNNGNSASNSNNSNTLINKINQNNTYSQDKETVENESSLQTEDKQDENSLESADSVESTEILDLNDSTKQLYLQKLDDLDLKLKNSAEERYSSSVTVELIEAANKEYSEWDYMLNEIYSQLKNSLSAEQMNNLTNEELEWITERDEKSKIAEEANEGGSITPLNGIMSLIESTKTRCYELVNKYMQ